MESFVNKIEEYSLISNLVPGYLLVFLLEHYVNITLEFKNVFTEVVVAYVWGVIISRIGALIVSEFLRKIGFVKFASYPNYVGACKKDAKINRLLLNANLYRNLLTAIICILIIKICKCLLVNFSKEFVYTSVLIFVVIVLAFSFRKEENTINGRIELIEDEKEKKYE